MQVSAEFYHGIDDAERAEIGVELRRLQALWEEGAPFRREYHRRAIAISKAPKGWQAAMTKELDREFAPYWRLMHQGDIPLALLACSECGRPTRSCTCDLQWGPKVKIPVPDSESVPNDHQG